MIGRRPLATAVSITEVVGKQNSVVTPSRFRISTTAWSARIGSSYCGGFGEPMRRAPEASTVAAQQGENGMPTSMGRRALLGVGVAAAALPRRTRAADKPIRIGVLTDMTGVYAANTGPGSVLGAQMAVEDFMRAHPEVKAEVVQADLQLKPDVALAIAADWYDNKGVDVVTDVPLSSAAFAIGELTKQKDKVAIFTG